MGVTENYASPANWRALWAHVVTEGTRLHAWQFYIHSLTASQRQYLLRRHDDADFFDAWDQLGVPGWILTIVVDTLGIEVTLLLTCLSVLAMAGMVVWQLTSPSSSRIAAGGGKTTTTTRRVIKKVTVIKKSVKQS